MQRDTVNPNDQVIITALFPASLLRPRLLEKSRSAPGTILSVGLCFNLGQAATQDGGVVLGFHIQKSP